MTSLPLHLLPDTSRVDDDGALTIGGCSVAGLAADFGTPLFVYDEQHLRNRCREAVDAFAHQYAVYATKAFLCTAMARLAYEEGMLLDVASGGEMYVALRAGVPADALTLHGNNKSFDELRTAMTEGVRYVVVDCDEEIDRIEALHRDGLPAPRVVLRITPGVHAHTHEYIATGQDGLEGARALHQCRKTMLSRIIRNALCCCASVLFMTARHAPFGKRRWSSSACTRTSAPTSSRSRASRWPPR